MYTYTKPLIMQQKQTSNHRTNIVPVTHFQNKNKQKQGRVLLVVPPDSLTKTFKKLGEMSCVEMIAARTREEVIQKIREGFDIILYEKSLYTKDVAEALSSVYSKTSFKQVKIFSEKSPRFSEDFLIKKVKEPCLP